MQNEMENLCSVSKTQPRNWGMEYGMEILDETDQKNNCRIFINTSTSKVDRDISYARCCCSEHISKLTRQTDES